MSASLRTILGTSLLGALLFSGAAFASSHREAPSGSMGGRTVAPTTTAPATPVAVHRPGYVVHPAVAPAAATQAVVAPKAPVAPVAPAVSSATPAAPAAPAAK